MKAMFDVIKYSGDNNVLVYRYPKEDFNTLSQLVVQQSQEAIFYYKGQIADSLTEGTHTLHTKNIPILRHLINLPFGGDSPFSAVLYFINKTEQINIKWGIQKVSFIEPTYGAALQVGASGILTFKVEDARTLLAKLIGTKPTLAQEEITPFLREIVNAHGRAQLADIFNKDRTIDFITAETILDELSNKLMQRLTPDFAQYGIKLERILISNLMKDEDSKAYKDLFSIRQKELRKAALISEGEIRQVQQDIDINLHVQRETVKQDLSKRAVIVDSEAQAIKRKQEGYTYQQQRGFDVAEKTAQNEGVGNFSSAGMGFGIGIGTMGAAAGAVGAMYNDALSSIRSNTVTANTPESTSNEPIGNMFSGVGLQGQMLSTDNQLTPPASEKKSKVERLKDAKELLDAGLIDQSEFDSIKKRILSEI